MNTSPDPFENDLRALQRRELPDAWREVILRAAAQKPPVARPPGWLLAGWGAAWAATLVLYATMPGAPPSAPMAGRNGSTPDLLWQEHAAAIKAMLAAN